MTMQPNFFPLFPLFMELFVTVLYFADHQTKLEGWRYSHDGARLWSGVTTMVDVSKKLKVLIFSRLQFFPITFYIQLKIFMPLIEM